MWLPALLLLVMLVLGAGPAAQADAISVQGNAFEPRLSKFRRLDRRSGDCFQQHCAFPRHLFGFRQLEPRSEPWRRRRRVALLDEEDYYTVDPPPNPRTPIKSGPIKYVDPAMDPQSQPSIKRRGRRRNKRKPNIPSVESSAPPGCTPANCKSWPSSSPP